MRIDWVGSALLAAAISCLVLLTTWAGDQYAYGSKEILGLAALTIGLGVAFVLVEQRVDEPAIPMRLFRNRTFCLSCVILFVTGVVMFTTITYLPTFLQVANGASASNSGLLLVPLFFGVFGSSIVAGQVISRTGRWRRFPIAGSGIATVGMYLLSTLDTHSSRFQSGLYMAIVGLGIGMVMQVLVLATQNEAPVEDLGVGHVDGVIRARRRRLGRGRAVRRIVQQSPHRAVGEGGGSRRDAGDDPQAAAHGQRIVTAEAFSDAITRVFLFAVPLLLLAFVLTWFLKETPLRTASGQARRAVAFDMEFAEESLGAFGDPALAYDDVAGEGGLASDGRRSVTVSLRERKKAETRTALASAALRLAVELGPDRVTVDEIAEAAGVSPRTFFNYFASKEDAILGNTSASTSRFVEHLAVRPPDESPLDALRAAMHASIDHLQSDPDEWIARNRLVRGYPSLAVRYAARLADLEREVVLEIARRTGLDADRDPYPGCRRRRGHGRRPGGADAVAGAGTPGLAPGPARRGVRPAHDRPRRARPPAEVMGARRREEREEADPIFGWHSYADVCILCGMAYRAAVVGGSGYTGAELLRLLAGHPEIEVGLVTADSNAGAKVSRALPVARACVPGPHVRARGHDRPRRVRRRVPRPAARRVAAGGARSRRHRRPPRRPRRRLPAADRRLPAVVRR